MLLGGSLAPIGRTVSFLAASLDTVLDELVEWRQSFGQVLELSEPAQFPSCLEYLRPLRTPWDREAVVGCGSWTAYFNNPRSGGDPTAAAPYLSKRLGTDCAVAIHAPPDDVGHASTQLWLLGPAGDPPLMYIRTIAAHAEDGRWTWDDLGTVQPFERVERYKARRIRDRFDRPLLIEYLAALGIRVDDPAFFGSGIGIRQC